ncbi:hypothetical protein [Novosphingobium malaysiense]|nr:hypothetical protein [Novosphingobium malaysiense]
MKANGFAARSVPDAVDTSCKVVRPFGARLAPALELASVPSP